MEWGTFPWIFVIARDARNPIFAMAATSHPTAPRNAQHDWKYISKKQALLSMFSASLLPLDPLGGRWIPGLISVDFLSVDICLKQYSVQWWLLIF
jgi:hypothetical protein